VNKFSIIRFSYGTSKYIKSDGSSSHSSIMIADSLLFSFSFIIYVFLDFMILIRLNFSGIFLPDGINPIINAIGVLYNTASPTDLELV